MKGSMSSSRPAQYTATDETNYKQAIVSADDMGKFMSAVDRQVPWFKTYPQENLEIKGENAIIFKHLLKGQYLHIIRIAEFQGQNCRPDKLEKNDQDRQIVVYGLPRWVIQSGQIFNSIKGQNPAKAENVGTNTALLTFATAKQAQLVIHNKHIQVYAGQYLIAKPRIKCKNMCSQCLRLGCEIKNY
uniref:RRM domain-containing protein n=1 Tax=Spongospora subterranea TaxID=70186 RepID=A0A0H5RCE1_9EUKA|eukprot:CRZ11416.1 hypothetical protein [Spongospora subterranea]